MSEVWPRCGLDVAHVLGNKTLAVQVLEPNVKVNEGSLCGPRLGHTKFTSIAGHKARTKHKLSDVTSNHSYYWILRAVSHTVHSTNCYICRVL